MLFLTMYFYLLILWHVGHALAKSHICSASSIPHPILFGAQVKSLAAYERHNYSLPMFRLTGLAFCNVDITYTHPGLGDSINVQVWLPLTGWNHRFQGTGGGGYATGMFDVHLALAVAQGYAAVSTDGGHTVNVTTAESWALVSPGNVNLDLLLNFGSRALKDMTVLGKAVTESYYGTAPKFSYWNGCSTGGRQGLMMAQRYPHDYDGILAAAPAINWPSFIIAEYWGQLMMNELGVYPPQCEFDAITAAAITACDGLDGLIDGIIAAPALCHFDAHSLVGQNYNCSGVTKTYSSAAAAIAEAVWKGARTTNDSFLWYGLNPGASFSGLLNTTCAADGSCAGVPFPIVQDWIRLFIEKDPAFNVTQLSFSDFDNIFHQSNQQYASVIATDDADLSAFRDAGGKMITWHGMSDQLIFPNGTVQYYQRVMEADPRAQDYYRFFEAPGVDHCGGGNGPVPRQAFDSLVRWVESGVAPDTLDGVGVPVNGTIRHQPLCAYPLVSAYMGGDPSLASSFACASSFQPVTAFEVGGQKGPQHHREDL